MSYLAMKTIKVSCVLSFFVASVALAGAPIGHRWDKTKPITYTFSADMNDTKKGEMCEAMQRIQSSSCITFEEDGDSDQKLVINNERDCESSTLGKESSNKPNELSINGCNTVVVYAHELLHALGFGHEEARSDRDDYITFYPNRSKYGYMESKMPADTDNFGVPFNYGSALMSNACRAQLVESTTATKKRNYRKQRKTKNPAHPTPKPLPPHYPP